MAASDRSETAASIDELGAGGSLHVSVCALSGKSGAFSVCASASVPKVCTIIESLVGIPANCQQWLVDGTDVTFQQAPTMADIGLQTGDKITVIHVGYVPLLPLPDVFTLTLTSVRQRLRQRYSSAFTIIYRLRAHIPEGWLQFEPWRKNDHDELLYDLSADVVESSRSHWMSGTTTHRRPLRGEDPLGDLRRGWRSMQKRVTQEEELFWLLAGSETNQEEGDAEPLPVDYDEKEQTRPNRSAVPGWFVAPSHDCVEIEVTVPLPDGRTVIRLLLDRDGQPVRAAVKGCQMVGLHEDIEEYVICLEAPETLSKKVEEDV